MGETLNSALTSQRFTSRAGRKRGAALGRYRELERARDAWQHLARSRAQTIEALTHDLLTAREALRLAEATIVRMEQARD